MGSGDQSSMVATELVPIFLRQGDEIIWQNWAVNSPYGISPLRLAFEKETDGIFFIFFFSFRLLYQIMPNNCQRNTGIAQRFR